MRGAYHSVAGVGHVFFKSSNDEEWNAPIKMNVLYGRGVWGRNVSTAIVTIQRENHFKCWNTMVSLPIESLRVLPVFSLSPLCIHLTPPLFPRITSHIPLTNDRSIIRPSHLSQRINPHPFTNDPFLAHLCVTYRLIGYIFLHSGNIVFIDLVIQV